MDTGLEGRVAIVTGAGRPRGIGAAIARALAREGARVVVSDIGRALDDFPDYQVAARDEIEQVREELEKLGAEAEVVHADVANESEMQALIARSAERFGRVDVMVNNAGLGLELVPVTEISVAAFRRNLEVMALGTLLGVREAARRMIEQGDGGAIINISSQAGKTGWPLLGSYCAAKFAILGLTQVAAKELGPHQITVNAICPGTVETPLLELPGGLLEVYAREAGTSIEGLKQDVLGQIPLGRFQQPEDVADVALFLASRQGRYLTGEALNATGGQEMH